MKPKFENIKTKAKEFMKTDKAKIGGACVCALLICVGVGFGVSAISSQNSQNLPSKALESTVNENTKTEGENTEKSSENATENTLEGEDEVTVNDKGEVVDSSGNVVAESVEQYNATQNSQRRPVATSNPSSGNNNTPQTQPSGSTQPAQQQHVHNWVAQTKTVQVLKYRTKEICRCKGCGQDISNVNIGQHMEQHALNGQSTQWVSEFVDEPYYDTETVANGYICTTCGATR